MLKNSPQRIKKLVDKHGRGMIRRRFVTSGPSYDQTKTPVDSPITGIAFDFETDEIDGTVIQKKDKMIIVASENEIKKEDKIVDDGIEYYILDLEQVKPGTDVMMYIIQGRA